MSDPAYNVHQQSMSGPYPGSTLDREVTSTQWQQLQESMSDPAYNVHQQSTSGPYPGSTLDREVTSTQLESMMDQIESMSDEQIMRILRLPVGSPAYLAQYYRDQAQYYRDQHRQLQSLSGEGA
jgi:hypothetical protein